MKRIDIKNFNFEDRLNEKIWCVELVSNNEEEISYEIYECLSEEEALKECEYCNKNNADKNYKYITVLYTVKEDYFEA